METLRGLAAQVEQIVKNIPGTRNINNSLDSGLSEFKYVLDQNALNQHGLSAAQVAITIRNILQGVEAIDIKLDNEDRTVIVKYDFPKKQSQKFNF